MNRLLRCFLTLLAIAAASAAVGLPAAAQSTRPLLGTPNLDCSAAVDIACGDLVQGTTLGDLNRVPTYPCLPPEFSDESGPEDVYRMVLTSATNVVIQLTPLLADDLDLILLSACDENACIEASASFPQPEIIVRCLSAGTYYVVVDGFEGAAGPYTLSLNCSPCPGTATNDRCESAEDLGCGTIERETNTVGAANDYTPGPDGNACTGSQAQGPDIVYRVIIPAGGTAQFQFTEETYDGSIYLVTDCNNPAASCLSGSDCFPFPCTNAVGYTNNTASDITAYLIVDGFNPSDAGLGTLTGTISCRGACCFSDGTCEIHAQGACTSAGGLYVGDNTICSECPTAVLPMSWGKVKSIYR